MEKKIRVFFNPTYHSTDTIDVSRFDLYPGIETTADAVVSRLPLQNIRQFFHLLVENDVSDLTNIRTFNSGLCAAIKDGTKTATEEKRLSSVAGAWKKALASSKRPCAGALLAEISAAEDGIFSIPALKRRMETAPFKIFADSIGEKICAVRQVWRDEVQIYSTEGVCVILPFGEEFVKFSDGKSADVDYYGRFVIKISFDVDETPELAAELSAAKEKIDAEIERVKMEAAARAAAEEALKEVEEKKRLEREAAEKAAVKRRDHEIYHGFLDDMPPMQAAKAKKLLDTRARFGACIQTYREWAERLADDGHEFYKKEILYGKTGVLLAHPKTEYCAKLPAENLCFVLKKTVWDYAVFFKTILDAEKEKESEKESEKETASSDKIGMISGAGDDEPVLNTEEDENPEISFSELEALTREFFKKIYDMGPEEYSGAVEEFDDWSAYNVDFLSDFIAFRGNYLSSDRECAAFYCAYVALTKKAAVCA